MNYMPYDTIYEICLQLEYDDIISLCKSEVIMNICDDKLFWMDKLRYDGISFSNKYNTNQLKILYHYKRKAQKTGNTHVTYKFSNLGDIVHLLPKNIIDKIGDIDMYPTHKYTPFVKIIFWGNGSYTVNIFNKSLKVIHISEEEALQLIEDLDNYINSKTVNH
jgi:hypothetical protein